MIKRLFLNRSIRTKIVWSSILISLVPLLILSYLFYRTSTHSLKATMIRTSNQNAEYLSDDLNQYFHGITTSALQIYGFDSILDLMAHGANYNNADILNLRNTLNNYYRLIESKNKDIIKIMVFGRDNILEDGWSRASSYDLIALNQQTPHYHEMMNLPFQHALMFTYHEPSLNQDYFVYAVPIYDPFYRTKYGTLVFYIQVKQLRKIVERYNRVPNVIVLQNPDGEIFYQTNDTYDEIVGKYSRPQLPASEGRLPLHFTNRRNLLVCHSFLDNGNIGLTLIYPYNELAKNRANLLRITISAFLLVMMTITIFSMLAHRFITRPVQTLGKAMRAFRNGNLQVSIEPYPWHDDLSELSRNFNYMTEKIRELIEQEYRMQIKNKEAQILALQMQINPHFLYNTLQTIGGKAILIGEYEIHEMCRALGDIFRYSFYEGNLESTIRLELAHVNNYLYIQHLRFEELLHTKIEIPAELMDCSIIRFVLQPIVENVIVHAMDKEGVRQLRIELTAERMAESLVILLRDNGPGIEADKLRLLQTHLLEGTDEVFSGVSIGLKNVHKRIRLVYGPPYGIEVTSGASAGTTIRMMIPYKKGEIVSNV